MYQRDVDRVQEFRKCIECFLCQDVCHVLREHDMHEKFGGPRFFVRTAGLEMHPLDGLDRTRLLKDDLGIGYCNITKCCTEVCPEEIHITDNAIIPLKERVVDEFYDPLTMMFRKLIGKSSPRREKPSRRRPERSVVSSSRLFQRDEQLSLRSCICCRLRSGRLSGGRFSSGTSRFTIEPRDAGY